MHETTPEIFLIARPSLVLDGVRGYLRSVGGESWLDRRLQESEGKPNAGELLVEFGGRACYRSWEPGLNPNVTRVRTDQREYFANILSSAHGSVLEHASYSFVLRNVSRVLTHELVRHRAGSAFSQESLRYVRLTDIGFRVPPALEPVRERVLSIVEQLEEFQRDAAAELGIDEEGVPFHVKKEVTAALGTDRLEHRHPLERERAHAATRDRDAHRAGRRGGATDGFRSHRRDHATRGTRALPGLRARRARQLAARAPQGLATRRLATTSILLGLACGAR
jgi:thymidylate synthase (FAD)